jgi:hypothetical protein
VVHPAGCGRSGTTSKAPKGPAAPGSD